MSNAIATVIVPPARLTIGYAELLLKGVQPEWMSRFAAPGGNIVRSNHPTFVFGHLSLYSSRMMGLLGKPEGVTAKPEKWDLLFKSGVECVDDPKGTIYPKHDVVVKHFFDGYRAVIEAIATVDDDHFLKPNPIEGRLKEMAPTIGAVMTFMLSGHPMSHLGQLSAWRRAWGLGSAM